MPFSKPLHCPQVYGQISWCVSRNCFYHILKTNDRIKFSLEIRLTTTSTDWELSWHPPRPLHLFISSLNQLDKIGVIIDLIAQLRKLKQREVKQRAKSHLTRKEWTQYFKLRQSGSKFYRPNHFTGCPRKEVSPSGDKEKPHWPPYVSEHNEKKDDIGEMWDNISRRNMRNLSKWIGKEEEKTCRRKQRLAYQKGDKRVHFSGSDIIPIQSHNVNMK